MGRANPGEALTSLLSALAVPGHGGPAGEAPGENRIICGCLRSPPWLLSPI